MMNLLFLEYLMALKRAVGFDCLSKKNSRLLGGSVLGDSFGTLGDGMLGELTGQQESDGGLDLATGDGRLPVVVGQTGSFSSNALEDVVHKAVHDRHSPAGDTSVGVDLLHDFVDVDTVSLTPFLSPLFVPWVAGCLRLGGLLCALSCSFWCHVLR